MADSSVDSPLVRRLLEAQFPRFAALPLTQVHPGGYHNRVFRLGTKLLVRLPRSAPDADMLLEERIWLPRLAAHLPLPIPTPVGAGEPSVEFPLCWSIYAWLPGEPAAHDNLPDVTRFALQLAEFLRALRRIDPTGGPVRRSRGGSLDIYDDQMQNAFERLTGRYDVSRARAIWRAALTSPIAAPGVWFHADIAPGNLLVEAGALSAVIDFGGVGVGDPACDYAIAWKFFDAQSRAAFRRHLEVNDAVWLRACAWALWKGMIIESGLVTSNAQETALADYAIRQVLTDNDLPVS